MNIGYNALLDATQYDCPIPTIKTKEMLDEMTSGAILKVVTSKEGTVRNLRTFVNNNQYELVHASRAEGNYCFYIKKL